MKLKAHDYWNTNKPTIVKHFKYRKSDNNGATYFIRKLFSDAQPIREYSASYSVSAKFIRLKRQKPIKLSFKVIEVFFVHSKQNSMRSNVAYQKNFGNEWREILHNDHWIDMYFFHRIISFPLNLRPVWMPTEWMQFCLQYLTITEQAAQMRLSIM